MAQSSPFHLPGFTLPLNYDETRMFRSAVDPECRIGSVETMWEISMMQVMNAITEKPEWQRKVFDKNITSKWQDEICTPNDLTDQMMDWVIKELQYKAEPSLKAGFVPAFDADVVKSDTAIPEDLRLALQEAVHPLEDVPEEQKDYHPGSDGQVLDLVHPSLFPVVYGRTRILKDTILELDSCLARSGSGQTLDVPPSWEASSRRNAAPRLRRRYAPVFPYSRKFQWLPCDVKLDGSSDGCRISSYINNLHPVKHRELYGVIQKIISRTIPLWNATLDPLINHKSSLRVEYPVVSYLPGDTPEPEVDSDANSETREEQQGAYWDWEESRPVEPPSLDPFRPKHYMDIGEEHGFNLREQFLDRGLQIIVKLANIELTLENPEYKGGSWHVEGQLNEHICATAIYYYSCENISHSSLQFRQRLDDNDIAATIEYEQNRSAWTKEVYGCPSTGPTIQDIGEVTCKQGRLLTFPNILQHRVAPFSLADPSKPGHRKILALFLVDPGIRVISSANVPPQRADWFHEQVDVRNDLLAKRLPLELQEMVLEQLDDFPIAMDDAKKLRLELMEERATLSDRFDHFKGGEFSLCEH